MANCAKTKKLKFSKMSANDVLQHLFLDFVLYLRGEKIPVLNGEKLEFEVEWNEDGTFKGSLRVNGDTNVADIAAQFGGGGHVKAAGFSIEGPIDTAMERILNVIREKI